MTSSIFKFSDNEWLLHPEYNNCDAAAAQLVLCFASRKQLAAPGVFDMIGNKFPMARVLMCSTAGEIFHNKVQDDTMVVAALSFNKTMIECASVNLADFNNSYDAATALVKLLPAKDLSYLLVLADGCRVNGNELLNGLNAAVEKQVLITGGMAGDGTDFQSALVGLDAQPAAGNIAVIGLYGKNVIITHGSSVGWQVTGTEREVTAAEKNKLFEIDHINVLDAYEKYMDAGEEKLSGAALLFPLSVMIPGSSQAAIRTIVSIDRKEKCIRFTGDIPVGSKVHFMRSSFDLLTYAAAVAAQNTMLGHLDKPSFSLMVSCVNRKIILGDAIEEEVKAALESMGDNTPVAGFYSYGEISPFNEGGDSRLHNQTMTITSFYEI